MLNKHWTWISACILPSPIRTLLSCSFESLPLSDCWPSIAFLSVLQFLKDITSSIALSTRTHALVTRNHYCNRRHKSTVSAGSRSLILDLCVKSLSALLFDLIFFEEKLESLSFHLFCWLKGVFVACKRTTKKNVTCSCSCVWLESELCETRTAAAGSQKNPSWMLLEIDSTAGAQLAHKAKGSSNAKSLWEANKEIGDVAECAMVRQSIDAV